MEEGEEEITAINVTPLVDVMLVLLVIFMVTTSYIVNQSINIQLPKTESSSTESVSKTIEFSLDERSNLYLDGEAISYKDIPEKLDIKQKELSIKNKKDVQALVSADIKTPHGEVIRLIDTIKNLGVESFAINVEAKATK